MKRVKRIEVKLNREDLAISKQAAISMILTLLRTRIRGRTQLVRIALCASGQFTRIRWPFRLTVYTVIIATILMMKWTLVHKLQLECYTL